MFDPNSHAPKPERPDPSPAVPESLARALLRRQTLDEQQRTFRAIYPPPHLFRRRPPG